MATIDQIIFKVSYISDIFLYIFFYKQLNASTITLETAQSAVSNFLKQIADLTQLDYGL